ncbi:MAG: hypothetical protein ACYDEQ_05575 [Desulfocucumaceae bacterium]
MAFRKDDMIDEINVKAGTLDWYTKNKKLLDKSVPEVVVLEKTVGDTYFSLVRNEKFQLIFTHQTAFFKRVATGSIENVDYYDGIRIQLTWNPEESFMKIADTTLEQNYFICSADSIA